MFLNYVLYFKFPIKKLCANKKKKLSFLFLVLYLRLLDFDKDFIMPPEENEMNDGRENQN